MASWFDDQDAGPQYITPQYQNSGIAGERSSIPGATASAGGGADPFAYTGGSLLTPWTKAFTPPGGSGGGYSAPAYSPFNFGDFSYSYGGAPQVDAERIKGPEKFSYADYKSADPYGAFKAPTADDMKQDPGYQVRLDRGNQAFMQSKAASGLLRSGAFAKGLSDYNQESASQEYGNVFNRAMGGYQTNRDTYGLNEGNRFRDYSANRAGASSDFDRNWGASFQTQNANASNSLQAGMANATNSLAGGRLGFDIASGQWDRNYGKARQGYEDQRSAASAAASAGASNSSLEYNRALQQYQMEHDIFQENQGNQFSRLMAMANLGNPGMVSPMQYGNAQGDIYMQRGNAQAAGQVGSGNAWNQAFGGIASGAMGAAGAYAGYHPSWAGGAT